MELSTTGESAALLEQACAAARSEAQATARRLNTIADLLALRSRQYGDRAEWVADLWDAIVAELAAALRVSRALASSYLSDAEILREHLAVQAPRDHPPILPSHREPEGRRHAVRPHRGASG